MKMTIPLTVELQVDDIVANMSDGERQHLSNSLLKHYQVVPQKALNYLPHSFLVKFGDRLEKKKVA